MEGGGSSKNEVEGGALPCLENHSSPPTEQWCGLMCMQSPPVGQVSEEGGHLSWNPRPHEEPDRGFLGRAVGTGALC